MADPSLASLGAQPGAQVGRSAQPNRKALRIVGALAALRHRHRVATWAALNRYVDELRLLEPSEDDRDPPPRSRRQPPAIDPQVAAIPAPPLPWKFQERKNSKRLLGAWTKGVEARRENRNRSDCYLTGAESIGVFGLGWDAMDKAVGDSLGSPL